MTIGAKIRKELVKAHCVKMGSCAKCPFEFVSSRGFWACTDWIRATNFYDLDDATQSAAIKVFGRELAVGRSVKREDVKGQLPDMWGNV